MHAWLAGSVAGVAGGAMWWLRRQQRDCHGGADSGDADARGEDELPSCSAARDGVAGSGSTSSNGGVEGRGGGGDGARRRLKRLGRAALAAGALAVLAWGALLTTQRKQRGGGKRRPPGSGPRIPLRELVRFREQQWFLEELENSREGDPNAMLRLAKMYLYGQGCERSVNLAQEWLRRARAGGVYCTLDELLTAEDLEAIRRRARSGQPQPPQQAAILGPGGGRPHSIPLRS